MKLLSKVTSANNIMSILLRSLCEIFKFRRFSGAWIPVRLTTHTQISVRYKVHLIAYVCLLSLLWLK